MRDDRGEASTAVKIARSRTASQTRLDGQRWFTGQPRTCGRRAMQISRPWSIRTYVKSNHRSSG